ncbi:ABC transporter ATP-binding protein [Candidatus Bathyarchaeota archaeon]|nr:ABC transporter ATP-binding protein [Candidatus Bathyarchaeota archaeon]
MKGEKIKLKAVNVTKIFNDGKRKVTALENFNLEVKENEFTVIVGPTGCGKSTFLYIVAGFEKPTKGEILLDGKPVTRPGPDRGFVFQEPTLYPWRTVLGNVMFGLEIMGMDKEKARERAMYFIRMVGLKGFENAYPHTLSGGMKQRVGIARALAYNPEILLMDEPFGALDAQTRKVMQQELMRIWEKTKKTVIFVTHSVIEAVYLADTIVVMTARPGKVKGIINVNLPRPRSYTDKKYLSIREKVLSLLEEEVTKSLELQRKL